MLMTAHTEGHLYGGQYRPFETLKSTHEHTHTHTHTIVGMTSQRGFNSTGNENLHTDI
jgi:hypothetical protein